MNSDVVLISSCYFVVFVLSFLLSGLDREG